MKYEGENIMRKLLLLPIMLLVLFIGCSKSNEFVVNMEGDAKIPTFNLFDLKGNKYTSKQLMENGKKTLFVVAAEWCPHCKEEMPHIQEFYNKNKDKVNVVVVFSNVNSSASEVEKYIKDNGYELPIYYDDDGSILKGFKIEAFPYNLKINGNKIEKQLDPPVKLDTLDSEFLN